MVRITLEVEGMMCAMCESHVNDVIRRNFPVKKVSSSHARGETVILAREPLDQERLRAAVAETGYRVRSVTQAPWEKKGLFSRR